MDQIFQGGHKLSHNNGTNLTFHRIIIYGKNFYKIQFSGLKGSNDKQCETKARELDSMPAQKLVTMLIKTRCIFS